MTTMPRLMQKLIKILMPYVYSRPYVYSFWQIFQALRLFPALRLFWTLEYIIDKKRIIIAANKQYAKQKTIFTV